MSEKVIGIMGGMGPEAGADLFLQITKAAHAKSDAEHLHIIMDSNPKMPSRQDAILRGTESPVPAMIKVAENLVRAGADVIIIGANTAHYFYDEVAAAVTVPFLHIIDEAILETRRQVPDVQRIGVMATTAAMQADVYGKSCKKFGIEIIPVPEDVQSRMQSAIFDHDYGFKYNGRTDRCVSEAQAVARYLIGHGAEALILGCTEIPLILGDSVFPVPLIDPNKIIAEAAVKFAKGV